MNYLLDTHTLIWAISKSHHLSKKVTGIIKDSQNEIVVSAVSFWEISIKARIGKLNLDGLTSEALLTLSEEMAFQPIGLTVEEAATYGRLEDAGHSDPFDRILIWQAISRNMTLLSKDEAFQKFIKQGLKLLW
jgi:PIN domain nuclease of toxin-antitoxin system